MAIDLNCVVVVGRLGHSAEFKMTPSGKELLKFSIANNQGWGDKKKVNWFDITFWGKGAAAIKDYMKKGKMVAVHGRLDQEKWEDKDGNKRQAIKIIADSVQLLAGNRDEEGGSRESSGGDEPPADEPPDASPEGSGYRSGPRNDDIPF